VTAGTLLAEIASPDFGQAQSNARRAVADFAQAEHTAARLRDLVGHGAVAQKDLQAAEADLVRAQSEQERTRRQLELYGGDAATIDQAYRLKAPIDGVVVEKNINPGQEVRPDQMLANVPQLAAPLFTISDPRRLWVQIDAREAELPLLEPGDPFVVHMHAFPEQSFPGRIDVVADAVDPATRMVRVRGSVGNPGRLLKAEMFVTVDLPSREPKAIHVATRAVFLKGEKHFVYVEPMPGRFLRREVRVGSEHDGRMVVLAGLESGERVVASGCLLLEQMLQSNG
jgi:cobalt-zinc-cadmium efflux system membrane fusion protein